MATEFQQVYCYREDGFLNIVFRNHSEARELILDSEREEVRFLFSNRRGLLGYRWIDSLDLERADDKGFGYLRIRARHKKSPLSSEVIELGRIEAACWQSLLEFVNGRLSISESLKSE